MVLLIVYIRSFSLINLFGESSRLLLTFTEITQVHTEAKGFKNTCCHAQT